MKFTTAAAYRQEIARVQRAMDSTQSEYLRRDYGKYKARLEKEMRRCSGEVRQQKGIR